MHKRGISPLIASVLLIAFAVTLFLIISTWVQRSVVNPALEEGGEKVAKTLDCLSAKITINSACAQNDNKRISVTFDNEGDITLTGVNIRVVGSASVQNFEKGDAIQLLERKKYAETVNDVAVGAISSIEVYPVLESGICRDAPAVKTPTKQATCN